MANSFKRIQYALTANSSLDVIYTVPNATTAIIMSAQVSNKDLSDSADVTAIVQGYNSSNTYLVRAVTVPVGSAFNFLAGKQVLQANDILRVGASANSFLDLTVSLLEIS
jgi:hypothetical protein